MEEPELVQDVGAELGEGPVWDAVRRAVWFVAGCRSMRRAGRRSPRPIANARRSTNEKRRAANGAPRFAQDRPAPHWVADRTSIGSPRLSSWGLTTDASPTTTQTNWSGWMTSRAAASSWAAVSARVRLDSVVW